MSDFRYLPTFIFDKFLICQSVASGISFKSEEQKLTRTVYESLNFLSKEINS